MSSKIYHNPNCGTSRNTLAIMRASGEEPEVVEYMKTPLSREQLVDLLAALAVPARELLRAKGDLYDELGLADLELSDDALIDAMSEHPILMNRPVVVTERGARLCRPSELVLDLLANPVREYTKEDGEVVRFSR
jgi:arsenate reductase